MALVSILLLALCSAPAFAAVTHAFTGVTIGPEGKSAAGTFTNLTSVAVDPSTGNIYVLDTSNNGRLYKFDSEGEPLDFTGTGTNFIEGTGFSGTNRVVEQIAVAPPGASGGTAGDIYIATKEKVRIYSPAGVELSPLTQTLEPCGVAVDASGNVFIKSALANSFPAVEKYTATTSPPTKSGTSPVPLSGESCNLAVDGTGHIYIANSTANPTLGEGDFPLWKLDSLTAETANLFDPQSSTVAVEPVTNDVYVSHGIEIVQYTESGSIVTKFGEGRLIFPPGVKLQATGIGIGEVGGSVYIASRSERASSSPPYSGRVAVYGPLASLPQAVAAKASSVNKTSAILHGTIDADGGPAATCEFQYTTQESFETKRFEGATSLACSPAGPFTGEAVESVSAAVSGLDPGTKYFYRLIGQNENGSLGSDENGSAPGEVPSFDTVPAFNVVTGPAQGVGPATVTLTGSINPEGVNVGECFFEYTTQTAFEAEQFAGAASAPCSPSGPFTGNSSVAVSAGIAGLTPSTEYRYRLVGGSAEFGGVKVRGAEVAFGTQGPPEISSQAFSGVGQTTATISGSINPRSAETSYVVEYITSSAYEANVQAGHAPFSGASRSPGVSIGSGFTKVGVSQVLEGLTTGTTYHFRLYAESVLPAHNEGPDEVFTTHVPGQIFPPCPANGAFRVEWSAALPDCRAYEQVSSPDKNGDSVAGLYPLMLAAEDGSAATFYSAAGALPPAGAGGTQIYPTYLARRNAAAGSWSSQRILPPEQYGELAEFIGATPDLRYAVVEAGYKRAVEEEYGLFVIDTVTGTISTIVPVGPNGGGINPFGFDGASADGSQIFFESRAAISTTPSIPAPAAGHDNLYVWDRATGDVSLVGVLPAGEGGGAPSSGSFGGAYEWYGSEDPSTGGSLKEQTGRAVEPMAVASLHAVSPDGQQIFFTSAVTGQLYLRRGLGGPSPSTTYISTPNAGVPGTPGKQSAAFQEATPDGSRAFFISRQKLTADAKTGSGEKGRDLYRWDASAPASEALTDVTPDPGDPNGAEVQGLLGTSADGSSGYFVARGNLAEGAKFGGENLYRFTEKTNGRFRITFIAILAAGAEGSPDRRNVSPLVNFGTPLGRTSRVSESGETLLFASKNPITGFDNFNLEGVNCEEGLCPEFYLYSAQAEQVTCVSCDPTGEFPLGAATLQDQFFDAYFTPNKPPPATPSANLSADGTKVFFQTPDPLVASDTNGNAGCPASGGEGGRRLGTGRCQDVYEWEAVGTGSCSAVEANRGCLFLLSTGQSAQPSYFVAASKDGSSAFVATASRLVPADRDQADDVYDAREGGGLASQHALPPTPCGSGEACKGAGAASPTPTSPATPNFQGPGNPKQKKCKKGYVAKKGKCVKKAKKHHRKATKRTTGNKRSGGAE